MSGTSWVDWRPGEVADRRRPLESRAALAFALMALLNVPTILIWPFGGPASWLLNTTSAIATIGITALYLLVARGVRRRRAWALVAIRPLLVVVTVFGTYAIVAAGQQGWLKIPVDVALAVWAWFGLPESRPARAGAGKAARAWSVVVVVALLDAAIWYGPPIFGWGGLLDVHQRDLVASLRVDCGLPGGPPPTVAVTYDWSWRTQPPFPSGLDVVVIGWRGADAQGRLLYLLGTTPDSGTGIRQGLQGFPSLDLAEQVERQTPVSWHWGIQLDHQHLAPGEIQLGLQLANASPPRPGPLTVTATYIHLGLWTASPPTVTCSW